MVTDRVFFYLANDVKQHRTLVHQTYRVKSIVLVDYSSLNNHNTALASLLFVVAVVDKSIRNSLPMNS